MVDVLRCVCDGGNMIESKQVTRMLPVPVNVDSTSGKSHDTRLFKSLCLEQGDRTILSFPFQI